jgi:hypothetical protein
MILGVKRPAPLISTQSSQTAACNLANAVPTGNQQLPKERGFTKTMNRLWNYIFEVPRLRTAWLGMRHRSEWA